MFYIMAGIGYDHSYFHKYKRIIQKAELSGNPNVDVFPSSADTLMNVSGMYNVYRPVHNLLLGIFTDTSTKAYVRIH